MASARGCSLARSTLAASRKISFSSNPAAATIATTFGLPSVSVPVLSTTSVSTFSMRSSASAFLISTPACAPRPTPTMIDIGVARPSAQGQAMISTLTAATRPNAIRGSGPNQAQAAKAMMAASDHHRHEPAGHLIGQPLDRRARTLRLGDHLDDLGQQRVAADLVGAHHEAAGLVQRARDHLGPGFLGDGHGFARHQGFVERGAAFENDAIHRHLLARPDPQMVADLQAVDLHLVVGAVIADAAGGLRRQFEQRPDRAGCRLAGAQFQHLAKQHEHGDHGGGFEIDRDRAAMAAEGRREPAWRDGANEAVEIGHAGADRDQGEHVEIAREQRLPAAHEERPARPDHHGRGEDQLNPVRQGRVDPAVTADQMTSHLEDHRRKREREADPEAPRHVGEFGIGRRIEARHLGLQRHAADRAASGADLADLRMHRAGIDRAFRRLGLRPAVAEIGVGVGGEFGAAAGRAEVMGCAVMVVAMPGGGGIDRHAADGVADGGAAGGMVAVVMDGVIVMSAAAACARIAGVGHRFSRPLATHTL